ncbi:MAG: flagellar protein FliT, partial [Lachnospira sp.]|nr:flagellar protein FliT [Lachnospira sp.]
MSESLIIKKDILDKLIVLNDEQEKIASAQEFDDVAFRDNVDAKAELIDELDRLDEGFNSLFARVKEQLDANRDAYKEDIATMQQLIRDITDRATSVEAKETRNRVLIQNKFMSMRKEVQNAKKSSQMANTYYKSMNKLNYEPHFMDQKK